MSLNYFDSEGKSLKDLETKIDTLERHNFDLKMQLFYLEQKERERIHSTESPINQKSEVSHFNNPEIDSEIQRLKKENSTLKKQVNEYESEKFSQTVTRSLSEGAAKLSSDAASSIELSQIEENRKRERRAALAVAEHDGAVIAHLEQEIARLLIQHASDLELIKKCNSQVDTLTAESTVRHTKFDTCSNELRLVKESQIALLARVDELESALKDSQYKQDLLVKALNEREQQLATSRSTVSELEAQVNKLAQSKKSWIKSPRSSVKEQKNNSAINLKETLDDPPQKIDFDITKTMSLADRISSLKHSTNEKKFEKHEEDKPNVGKLVNRLKSTNLSLDLPRSQSTTPKSVDETIKPITLQSESIKEVSKPDFDQKNVEFSYEGSVDELNQLRRENSILRDQLDRSRATLKTHEEILQKIRSSAEELTLIEAEEIARLYSEVERLTKENKGFKDRVAVYESESEINHKKLLDLEKYQKSLTARNDVNEDYIKKISNLEKLIDMYKNRELELLNALETVVKKCQGLEAKQSKKKFKSEIP